MPEEPPSVFIDRPVKVNLFPVTLTPFEVRMSTPVRFWFPLKWKMLSWILIRVQSIVSIANLILGIMMYSDRNREFSVNELETRINKAKLLIRENLTNNISLESIASEINMSYSWFRKIFKEYTGFSPANYIQEMKLQRAKNLLISSDLSIKEIAYSLNFDSISYFSSTFRKKTGYTPLQYRMSIKMP